MKKYLLSVFILVSGFNAFAQQTTASDALRLAVTDLNGTARFRAMSGAFGAVGGDLSAINVNPAGSAVFNHNSATGTLGIFNSKNNSNYFGTSSSDSDSTLDISQLGAVFVFNDNGKSDWKKIAIAFNFELNNNFNNSYFSRGTNPTTSIGNYFLNFANTGNNGNIFPQDLMETQPGESITDLYDYLAGLSNGFEAQQAFLGYQAYLYNYNDGTAPDPDVAPFYESYIPGGSFYQQNSVVTTGYNGKITANVATQYQDKLYFGLNLNAHFTDIRKTSSVYERNGNNPALGVQEIQFDNELYTYGGGFSFNLGVIAKFSESFRGGLAYESPTWYRLNDELTQQLISSRTDDGVNTETTFVSPDITNIYAPYKIQTPGKFTGSLAYVFGKKGLISFDYAIKDYSNTQFRPKRETMYRELNAEMADALTMASEFRIGAEYKIKQASLRAGYRYEESPYKNGKTIGDLTGFTAGLGYNFIGSRLDLAYSFSKRDSEMQFVSSGMTDAAKINTKNNNILISYTMDF
ncbi:OmpP1/FadL family transporter [Flavobacterium pedocola]